MEASAHTGPRPARWVDSESVLGIDSLELRARIVVDGFLSGLHKSPYHGFSAEFSEYRPYSQGDDLRYLDWKLLGRTDKRFVKRFEDETNLRCHLLVDLSRSMSFGEERRPKVDYAVTLAATLARFLSTQRDAVGLVTFDQDLVDVLPARHRTGHLLRLFALLERSTAGEDTGVARSLERVAAMVRKRGVVVLISDLLAPLDGLDVAFGQLRARGHEVLVFRVLDPAEVDFPFERASRFQDLESGRSVYVDPGHARGEYRRRFGEHAAALQDLATGHGVDLVTWTTDQPLVDVLHAWQQARARRGRLIRRRERSSR